MSSMNGDEMNVQFINRIDAMVSARSDEAVKAIAAEYLTVVQARLHSGMWQSHYADITRRKLIVALDGRARDFRRQRHAHRVYRETMLLLAGR